MSTRRYPTRERKPVQRFETEIFDEDEKDVEDLTEISSEQEEEEERQAILSMNIDANDINFVVPDDHVELLPASPEEIVAPVEEEESEESEKESGGSSDDEDDDDDDEELPLEKTIDPELDRPWKRLKKF